MGAGRTDNKTENLSIYGYLFGTINDVLSRWELVGQIMKLRTCPTTVSSTELFQLLLVYLSTQPRYLSRNKINLRWKLLYCILLIPIAKSLYPLSTLLIFCLILSFGYRCYLRTNMSSLIDCAPKFWNFSASDWLFGFYNRHLIGCSSTISRILK